jgi:hypothetical protein
MRRATLSVAPNTADGPGRETRKEPQRRSIRAKGPAFAVVSIATIGHRRGRIPIEPDRDPHGRVEDRATMLSGVKRSSQPIR